jgi:ubiquinone/menaquinone biosynthesis C-methylase UbiE
MITPRCVRGFGLVAFAVHVGSSHTGGMAGDRDVAHFDRWSSHYDRSVLQRFFFGPIQEATISEAAIRAPSVEAVLDVGCGTGQLLRRIDRRFPDAELVGVDPAPGMVKQARAARSDGRIDFVNGSAESLPFPDAHFDLVLTTLSFHHWADQQQGLHEIRRVLRSGGLFVLTDILVAGWLRWLLARRPSEGRFNSSVVLDRMLEDENFRIVQRASVPWRPQIKITLAQSG